MNPYLVLAVTALLCCGVLCLQPITLAFERLSRRVAVVTGLVWLGGVFELCHYLLR